MNIKVNIKKINKLKALSKKRTQGIKCMHLQHIWAFLPTSIFLSNVCLVWRHHEVKPKCLRAPWILKQNGKLGNEEEME